MILLRGKCLLGKIPFEPDLATGGSLWNGAGSNGTQIHGASRLLSRHLCRRVWASAGHRDSHLCLLPRGHSEEEGEQHSPLRQAQDEPAPGASSCSQLPGGCHLLCPPNTSPVGSCAQPLAFWTGAWPLPAAKAPPGSPWTFLGAPGSGHLAAAQGSSFLLDAGSNVRCPTVGPLVRFSALA